MDDPANNHDLARAGAGKAQTHQEKTTDPGHQGHHQDDPILPPMSSNHSSLGHTNNPAAADDSDLIEREWVERAREIVSKSRANPYLRSKELTKLKADYLKKRYGKDIQLTEE